MSKALIVQLQAKLADKDAQIQALKIQVMHTRDITLHHMTNLLCSIVPHDENCHDMMITAVDMLRAEEYKPLVILHPHA
jgi:hypothetical protein